MTSFSLYFSFASLVLPFVPPIVRPLCTLGFANNGTRNRVINWPLHRVFRSDSCGFLWINTPKLLPSLNAPGCQDAFLWILIRDSGQVVKPRTLYSHLNAHNFLLTSTQRENVCGGRKPTKLSRLEFTPKVTVDAFSILNFSMVGRN